MRRNFNIVDYVTKMTTRCPGIFNLGNEFTMSSSNATSPHLGTDSSGGWYDTFDFRDNIPYNPFCQQFEELNPVINETTVGFKFVIYPNIRFTYPNGFEVRLECLIPGFRITDIKQHIKPGKDYNADNRIVVNDHQVTRLNCAGNTYIMSHIDEIQFEIDRDHYECTPEGFKNLTETFPETDVIGVEFICLTKTLPELYSDHPIPDPIHGCDDPNVYYKLHVMRNRKLYDLMF